MTTELISEYIGKECIINTMTTQVVGTIESLNEGWIKISRKDGTEIVNLDFVVRISEYPRNRNGKKKSVVVG